LILGKSPKNKKAIDEFETISLIWNVLGQKKGPGNQSSRDPFSDDVVWLRDRRGKFLIFKSDMLVSTTDAPSQMTAREIGAKAIVSCVSDFAAKGVKPVACLLSIALPKEKSNSEFVAELAKGFKRAADKYAVRVIGGDTNESKDEVIIDCSLLGFADRFTRRVGAKPGDLLGTTGRFGLQSVGLDFLMRSEAGNVEVPDSFRTRAINSVLKPEAKLGLGLSISRYISSSIDSSDGLALSLYQLAEASGVDLQLSTVPVASGVEEFARRSSLDPLDLALFGGEEYEIVFTFPRRNEKKLRKLGIIVFGKVGRRKGGRPRVYLDSKLIPRKGYVHNKV
jgi:thiamine-monophosphate kinase